MGWKVTESFLGPQSEENIQQPHVFWGPQDSPCPPSPPSAPHPSLSCTGCPELPSHGCPLIARGASSI